MKKLFVLLVLTAVWLAVPATALCMDYQHSMKAGDMSFAWQLEEDRLHVQLSAETEGWVAVGFNPETAMLNANILIGYVENGAVSVEDHFGIGKRRHGEDTRGGGSADVENPAGSEEDGITTVSFAIPLDSGDKYDPPVKGDGSDIVILAYGTRDSVRLRHKFRATYKVNLQTGETEKIR